MDLVDFLSIHVFPVKQVFHNGVKEVSSGEFERHNLFFDDNGVLEQHYPVLFGIDVVKKLHPSTSTAYGRFLITVNLLSSIVYHYQAEKHKFCEWVGSREAKEYGYEFMICENLS